jgi:hypothetical protein
LEDTPEAARVGVAAGLRDLFNAEVCCFEQHFGAGHALLVQVGQRADAVGGFKVAQQGSACSSGDPNFISYTNASSGAAWSYLPWQTRSFDLTNYIGQCVNIEFTVGGCVAAQGAHPGYCYIDAACDPMTLNVNGIDIPVGQTGRANLRCASVQGLQHSALRLMPHLVPTFVTSDPLPWG